MKFGEFIKEKILLIFLVLFIIASSEILLLPYPQIEIFVRLYIAICPVIIIGIDIVLEYRKKSNFYNELKNNLEKLDTKYLISEIINTPDFIEGKILKKTIQETGKSMLENVNSYKQLQEDYKEYIELWIHEIKIPIATSKLIIENNKNEITKSIDEELDEIENYTEQALFYARSNTVNKDYVVTKSNLKDKQRYTILRKIGCDENMINKALFRQIGIFFGIPLVLAIIHSVFGIQFAITIMSGLASKKDLLPSAIATVIIIGIIYGTYFLATYLGSRNIIKEE